MPAGSSLGARRTVAAEVSARQAVPPLSRQVKRSTGPIAAPAAPWDPWASDSEEEVETPSTAAASADLRPRLPLAAKEHGSRSSPAARLDSSFSTASPESSSRRFADSSPSRPNPLLAGRKPRRISSCPSSRSSSRGPTAEVELSRQLPPPPDAVVPDSCSSTKASSSPWSTGSRSPSRPNPLLVRSRSPSLSRQADPSGGSARMRAPSQKKRPDVALALADCPTSPTLEPAAFLQSLFPEPQAEQPKDGRPALKTRQSSNVSKEDGRPALKTRQSSNVSKEEGKPALKTRQSSNPSHEDGRSALKTRQSSNVSKEDGRPVLKTRQSSNLSQEDGRPVLKTRQSSNLSQEDGKAALKKHTGRQSSQPSQEEKPPLKQQSGRQSSVPSQESRKQSLQQEATSSSQARGRSQTSSTRRLTELQAEVPKASTQARKTTSTGRQPKRTSPIDGVAEPSNRRAGSESKKQQATTPPAQVLGNSRTDLRESQAAARKLVAPWDISDTEDDVSMSSPSKSKVIKEEGPSDLVARMPSGSSDDAFSFIGEATPQVDSPSDSMAQDASTKIKEAYSSIPVFSFQDTFGKDDMGKEPVITFDMKQQRQQGDLLQDSHAGAPHDPCDFQKPGQVHLSSLSGQKEGQSTRVLNTDVRLPRMRELPKSVPEKAGSCKATDRWLGLTVPEYGYLMRLVQAQQVLGSSWDAETRKSSILYSLAMWYLPLAILPCLVIAVICASGTSEASLWVSPLFLLLPVVHSLRSAFWDRRLLTAVDRAASADIRDQLRAPLGWGEDGQVFSANLSAAMQALSIPTGELLLAPPRRTSDIRSVMCGLLLLLPLMAARLARHLLGASVPPGWLEAEAALLCLCLLVLVLFGCRPSKELRRAELVDSRMEALECAYNALLDTLRPLLGQSGRPRVFSNLQAKVVGVGAGESDASCVDRFAVRLITAARQTLRGSLSITKEECSMLVSCPLGGFDLVATGLEGAMATELGRAAAGDADMMVLSPSAGERAGSAGSSLPSWASALAARFGNESSDRRARGDDDIASVSTASTLTRGKNQVDEASMHLALAAVTALTRRRHTPLEVFRSEGNVGIIPPKVPSDEPSLVLALAEDQLNCFARQHRHCDHEVGGSYRYHTVSRKGSKDTFGVVRDSGEMKLLCTDEVMPGMSSKSNITVNMDSPRSVAASQGSSDSEDELNDRAGSASPKWPASPRRTKYAKLFTVAPRHLALVFDSFSARDRCLTLLRETLPMPAHAPSPIAGRSGLLAAALEAVGGSP